ncbi:thiosulfate oxidation carrier complex protein SoxZ [Falsiroseomonas sp.]|uniref:thiosulfate oxidation carrier complex protein SoxZ n=1 Tax=Falsiroseomonas sp. TaxID=2870721 RepID=UPI003563D36A
MAEILARITLPESAKRGEIVPVRVIVRHPMERAVDAPGLRPVPRKILHTLRVTYAGAEVFRMAMSPGIAANPYVEFTTIAVETGDLVFEWEEDGGAVYRREARLVVT